MILSALYGLSIEDNRIYRYIEQHIIRENYFPYGTKPNAIIDDETIIYALPMLMALHKKAKESNRNVTSGNYTSL